MSIYSGIIYYTSGVPTVLTVEGTGTASPTASIMYCKSV